MRTIFYASNMQSLLFPSNSRSNFETYIHPQDLSYISNKDVEVAIKSITFDNNFESYFSDVTLALKTSLSSDTISSYGWDKIVSIFTVNPSQKGICQFEFSNPTFFPTNHHNLSRASFQIINIKTGVLPEFFTGSPTFIEVLVRSQAKRMKTPFHVLLDSSCLESEKRFPKNTNMEFCIQLPKRMEFQKDWMLCLKSIHFSNKFYTLQNCTIAIRGKKPDGNQWLREGGLGKKSPHDLAKVIKQLNRITRGILKFSKLKDDIVVVKRDPNFKETELGDTIIVEMSSDLIQILGFRPHQTMTSVLSNPTNILVSTYKGNVYALHPHHFIVCCDLVEESILGGQHVQVLKYFPRKLSMDSAVDLEFSNNDYLKLNLKNFDRIRIRIADITGKTIECDPITPTRMQLMFVNTNSH